MSLRFYFSCFALCAMTPPDPDYPADADNQPEAKLLGGFFTTRTDAESYVAAHETALIREYGAWCKAHPHIARFHPYKAGHYEIVPLSSVRFASLDALEDAIRQAAVLQFAGVGAEVA